MAQEKISRNATSLIHPISGSYILLDDDGNIRIGLKAFGDMLFISATDGHMYLNANTLTIISDKMEWNNLVLNKAAVNPTQPTFTQKKNSTKLEELSKYDK